MNKYVFKILSYYFNESSPINIIFKLRFQNYEIISKILLKKQPYKYVINWDEKAFQITIP